MGLRKYRCAMYASYFQDSVGTRDNLCSILRCIQGFLAVLCLQERETEYPSILVL